MQPVCSMDWTGSGPLLIRTAVQTFLFYGAGRDYPQNDRNEFFYTIWSPHRQKMLIRIIWRSQTFNCDLSPTPKTHLRLYSRTDGADASLKYWAPSRCGPLALRYRNTRMSIFCYSFVVFFVRSMKIFLFVMLATEAMLISVTCSSRTSCTGTVGKFCKILKFFPEER